VISTKSSTSSADVSKEEKKVSPTKPRMTLLERQAIKDAEKKANDEKANDSQDKLATSLGGAGALRAPSRLMKGTASTAASANATEDRKKKLLEK
jgi:hypothetical protein